MNGGIIDSKTGEIRTAEEFMREVRRRAAERESHRQPPKQIQPKEVPL